MTDPNPNPNPGEMDNPSSSPLSSISEPDLSSFSSPRPARSRKSGRHPSPSKNGDGKEMPDSERPKKQTLKKPAKRTAKKPKWDSESILTDSKSPLATASLRSILSNPMAWSALDQDERAEVLSLFPDKEHIIDAETEDARPNFASLLNDDSFRHDCAAYTENIALGRHDPEWLASAWIAHERRRAGDFDKHLTTKLEEDWEVEIPEQMRLCRREAGQTAENSDKSDDAGEGKTADTIQVDVDMKEASISTKQLDETKMEVDTAHDP